jgi:hypothetical protein
MRKIVFFLALVFLTTMCKNAKQETTETTEVTKIELKAAPEWSKNANIYEVLSKLLKLICLA